MPDRSEKVSRLNEQTDEYELPYLSKSRVKTWLENPEHFRLKYLEGISEPETAPMVRGSRIHETFEHVYRKQLEKERFVGVGAPDLLPEDRELWADFIEPYITNFLNWESKRWLAAGEQADGYLPISVEEEHWRDPVLGIENEPEWMGLADVILPAESVPESYADEGVIIVDFKTGSVPDKQYRSPGIYEELEYYKVLFEEKYDVAGAGAYYPKEDRFLLQPEKEKYREAVFDAVEELVSSSAEYEGKEFFETDEGPLCKWGPDADQQSAFYGVCTQCNWGVPAQNEETLRALVDEGYADTDIAEHLGTSTDSVNYWKYKFDLK